MGVATSLFALAPILLGGQLALLGGIVLVIGLITITKRWGWLWHNWLTTVDHK